MMMESRLVLLQFNYSFLSHRGHQVVAGRRNGVCVDRTFLPRPIRGVFWKAAPTGKKKEEVTIQISTSLGITVTPLEFKGQFHVKVETQEVERRKEKGERKSMGTGY